MKEKNSNHYIKKWYFHCKNNEHNLIIDSWNHYVSACSIEKKDPKNIPIIIIIKMISEKNEIAWSWITKQEWKVWNTNDPNWKQYEEDLFIGIQRMIITSGEVEKESSKATMLYGIEKVLEGTNREQLNLFEVQLIWKITSKLSNLSSSWIDWWNESLGLKICKKDLKAINYQESFRDWISNLGGESLCRFESKFQDYLNQINPNLKEERRGFLNAFRNWKYDEGFLLKWLWIDLNLNPDHPWYLKVFNHECDEDQLFLKKLKEDLKILQMHDALIFLERLISCIEEHQVLRKTLTEKMDDNDAVLDKKSAMLRI